MALLEMRKLPESHVTAGNSGSQQVLNSAQ
jgi:hypothetical protein